MTHDGPHPAARYFPNFPVPGDRQDLSDDEENLMLFTLFAVDYESRRKSLRAHNIFLSILGFRWYPVSEMRSLLCVTYSPRADFGRKGVFSIDFLWFHVFERRWEV